MTYVVVYSKIKNNQPESKRFSFTFSSNDKSLDMEMVKKKIGSFLKSVHSSNIYIYMVTDQETLNDIGVLTHAVQT